jgi:hypothetical protein
MAGKDDRRKNFWDEEDSDEQTGVGARRAGQSASSEKAIDSTEIDRKLHETKVLMDQTHQLYLHYFSGFEKRTPIEKLKLLEARVNELQRLGTNLTTAKFKISQFLAQYSMMKELWERKLREKEKK